MSDQPDRSEEAEQARQLLAEALRSRERAWPDSERVRRTLALSARLNDVARPARTLGRWLPAVAGLLVAAGVLVRVHGSPPARSGMGPVSLGEEGSLEVSPDGAIELPAASPTTPGRRILLKSGSVCAEVAHRDLQRQGPLFVEAPHLRVTVIGTHFCVATRDGVSTVSVTQGKVRAERIAGIAVAVAAGESLRSDDPRLAASAAPAKAPEIALKRLPATPPEVLPATPDCADARSIAARRACYERAARGHDMAAQNALYGLGLLEQDEVHDGAAALEVFRRYEARFPQGVFAPEASFAALGELLEEKRFPEALQETAHYLALGDDSGKDRARFVRAQLLLGPLGQPAQALPLLRQLVDSGEPALREEALFTLALCQEALGQQSESATTLRRSLADYPDGTHAAEIRARLR